MSSKRPLLSGVLKGYMDQNYWLPRPGGSRVLMAERNLGKCDECLKSKRYIRNDQEYVSEFLPILGKGTNDLEHKKPLRRRRRSEGPNLST